MRPADASRRSKPGAAGRAARARRRRAEPRGTPRERSSDAGASRTRSCSPRSDRSSGSCTAGRPRVRRCASCCCRAPQRARPRRADPLLRRPRRRRWPGPRSAASSSPGRSCRRADPVIAAHRVDPAAELPCPAATVSSELLQTLLAEVDAVVLQGPVTRLVPRAAAERACRSRSTCTTRCTSRRCRERRRTASCPTSLNLVRRPAAPRRLLLLRERAPARLLARHARRARPRDAGGATREDPDLRSLIDVVPYGISARAARARRGRAARHRAGHRARRHPARLERRPLGLVRHRDVPARASRRCATSCRCCGRTSWACGVPARPSSRPRRAQVMALSDELGLTGKTVFFNDWTPYDRRQDVYLDATAIVSLHHAHLESRFSFRTRLLDALWGRVPIVCTSGDVRRRHRRGAAARPDRAAGRRRRGRARRSASSSPTPPCSSARACTSRRRRLRTSGSTRSSRSRAGSRSPPGERPRRDRSGLRAADARQARREDLERYANELKMLVPTPVRQHVLGPAKRGLRGVLRAARSSGLSRLT